MSETKFKNGSFHKSLICAAKGVIFGMKGRNTRILLTAFVFVVFLGAVLNISKFEWLAILIVSAGVLSLELINTAVEDICDRLRDDLGLAYESTRAARDVAAGAVLVSALAAASCGVIIFLPKLLVFFCTAF